MLACVVKRRSQVKGLWKAAAGILIFRRNYWLARNPNFIPTPVGNYNPDWAIAFQQGAVKHVYFVAETKGSMSSMEFRAIELAKIKCARKFFAGITSGQVRYDVVDSYGKLMELVK